MGEFKLYFLDDNDKIKRREDHELADDATARAKAYELDHAYAIEIWEGTRLVGRVFPNAAFGVGPGASSAPTTAELQSSCASQRAVPPPLDDRFPGLLRYQ